MEGSKTEDKLEETTQFFQQVIEEPSESGRENPLYKIEVEMGSFLQIHIDPKTCNAISKVSHTQQIVKVYGKVRKPALFEFFGLETPKKRLARFSVVFKSFFLTVNMHP